jgi:hypothetical protein
MDRKRLLKKIGVLDEKDVHAIGALLKDMLNV